MKKKILLICSMLILLVLCLTFVASAESPVIDVPSYDRTYNVGGVEYPLWEMDSEGNYHPLMWYQTSEGLKSVWADNLDTKKAPYVVYATYSSGMMEMQDFNIYDKDGNVFNGKKTVVIANLHKVYPKAGNTSQVTHIHKNAFKGSTVLKAIYIPSTLKYIGWYGGKDNFVSFANCTALEYVEFPSQVAMTSLDCNAFDGCTSLKAMSLPDSIKTINYVAMVNCTSLQAVYLPRGLTEFGNNGWNRGAFYNCPNLYFVNEPFILNSTCTNIPEKPTVYYFPENLTELGECVRACPNINDVLVIGDKITSHVSTMWTGTADSGETKTIVYLGNMTQFSHTEGIGYQINFVFPNTTSDQITVKTGARNYSGSAIYFCKLGKKCTLAYNSVSWSEDQTHFYLLEESTQPTCTTDGVNGFKCFCGMASEESEVVLAYGHLKSEIITITYNGEKLYFENGDITYKCERCGESHTAENEADFIFKAMGYTATTKENPKKAIMQSFAVNREALLKYNENTENDILDYGVLAATENGLGETKDVFDADGKVVTSKVNLASYLDKSFDIVEMKLGGLEGEKDGNKFSSAKIYCCAYILVKNGDTIESYYASESVGGTSNVIGQELGGSVSFDQLTA